MTENSIVGYESTNPFDKATIIPAQHALNVPFTFEKTLEVSYNDMIDTLRNGKALKYDLGGGLYRESPSMKRSLGAYGSIESDKGTFYLAGM